MIIRNESASDVKAIRHVVESAFGRTAEADLVDRLRTDGDAVISLVAVDDDRVIGHVLQAGWACVFVLGDPAYYTRFDFDTALASGFKSPYAGPHFMALALGPKSPGHNWSGRVRPGV
ncbi:MAG TPA: N-acetyltransferase [Steroidobacteraceae bacterium]